MNLKETSPQKNPDHSVDTHPNPSRFAIYNILPGEFGFTIPNCDFVFEFDRNGGWFDEYGNYYNANGDPAEVPVEYEGDLEDDPQEGYYEDETNNDGNVNEKEDVPLEFYDNQYLNQDNREVLKKYKKKDEISVELHNLSTHWREDNFEKFLGDNNIKWVRFKFEFDSKDQFTGCCYLDLDEPNALKLLELNGYKILGKNLNILVIAPRPTFNNDDYAFEDEKDSSVLPKPKEEAKTLENDQDEPTLKRPYPNGKPTIPTLDSEKNGKKDGVQHKEKILDRGELPQDGDIRNSKKGD